MSRFAIVTMVQRRDLPWAYASLGSMALLARDDLFRLVLVNDTCDADTAAALARVSAGEVIVAGENLGVAGGRNRLIREAAVRGADHIISIDDDILLPGDFAGVLIEEFEQLKKAGKKVGIVTPATLDYHKVKSRIYSTDAIAALARGDIVATADTDSVLAQLGEVSADDIYHMGIRDWRGAYCFTNGEVERGIQDSFGIAPPQFSGSFSNLRGDPSAPSMITGCADPVEVDTAPGGICMYSLALFEELGGVCESFNPFGYEDADFALRARALGYQHYCAPRAVAVHDIAGRLSARPLSVLMASQGKMAGAFASRHLSGKESAAAMLCIGGRVAASMGMSQRSAREEGETLWSVGRLEALLAFAGNALLYALPDRTENKAPELEACHRNLSALAAMSPTGQPAFEADVEGLEEGLRIRFSNLVLAAPKRVAPPLIDRLAAKGDPQLSFSGVLDLGAEGAFRLQFDGGGAESFLVSGEFEGWRSLRPDHAVGSLHIRAGQLKIEDCGVLARYLRYLAGMEARSPSAYVTALEDKFGSKIDPALFDWLRGASNKIDVSFSGVLDGAPGPLKLDAAFAAAQDGALNPAVCALMKEPVAKNFALQKATTRDLGMKKAVQAVSRLLAEDPKVAPFPEAYNPGAPLKFVRKLRYLAASRGVPMTANEKRILQYRNYAAGKRAFIIGNGPSLNKIDLTLLKDEYTFGVNAIYLNKDKMGFLPTHYIVEDVFVAEDRADEINALRGPTKWIGNYLRYCLEGDDGVCWMNVACDYRQYEDFPHFSQDASRIVWVGGTVSYIAMQLAYYMGFSEVYLVGFDHSYTVPKEAEVEGRAITSTSDDPNHFHPDYFGKGYRWHDPRVDRMEVAYRKARKHYEAAGRKIFNATAGGHLETFERVDYAALFADTGN